MGPEFEPTGQDVGPHAFLVRLWVEPREVDARPRVRAWVQHLASGEEANVADLDQLVEFLAEHSGGGAAVLDWGGAS